MSGGWFSDIDLDRPRDGAWRDVEWQPCITTRGGACNSLAVWFSTEAECDEYIVAELLPVAAFFNPRKMQQAAPLPKE